MAVRNTIGRSLNMFNGVSRYHQISHLTDLFGNFKFYHPFILHFPPSSHLKYLYFLWDCVWIHQKKFTLLFSLFVHHYQGMSSALCFYFWTILELVRFGCGNRCLGIIMSYLKLIENCVFHVDVMPLELYVIICTCLVGFLIWLMFDETDWVLW